VQGTGDGPPDHDQQEAPARAQRIEQAAPQHVHGSIGEQERRLQIRELLVRQRDVSLDGGDRDRQRLPVEVADCNRNRHHHNVVPPAVH
jgi:hypothetical protein